MNELEEMKTATQSADVSHGCCHFDLGYLVDFTPTLQPAVMRKVIDEQKKLYFLRTKYTHSCSIHNVLDE